MWQLLNNSFFSEFSKYSIVGFLNTIVGYSFIYLGVLIGLSPYLSNLLGYTVGVLFSFAMNHFFVFSSKLKNNQQILKYIIAFIVSYLANLIALYACIHSNIAEIISLIISSIIYFRLMFLFSKVWIYRII